MENINQLTNQPVSNEALEGISTLAEKQLTLEQRLIQLQDQADIVSGELARFRDILIPDAMSAVGMSSFKLKDGTSVTVVPFYSAKIPEDKLSLAHKWLRDNKFGELIKHVINVNFGKGDDEIAIDIAKYLEVKKVPFVDKESVHPQTLKAFVKERSEKGETLPQDLFGVFIGNRAKITPAK